MGWTIFNDTIHANNWYLETLVSLGSAGSLPFFAWLALLLREVARALRGVGTTTRPGSAGGAGEVGPTVVTTSVVQSLTTKVVTTGGIEVWRQALGAGLLAYFIHGLLDYFLLFNATGLLFWTLVGLWAAQRATWDRDSTDPFASLRTGGHGFKRERKSV